MKAEHDVLPSDLTLCNRFYWIIKATILKYGPLATELTATPLISSIPTKALLYSFVDLNSQSSKQDTWFSVTCTVLLAYFSDIVKSINVCYTSTDTYTTFRWTEWMYATLIVQILSRAIREKDGISYAERTMIICVLASNNNRILNVLQLRA